MHAAVALLDLFAMAQENAAQLASQCAEHTGAQVEFARGVEKNGRLSVTMRFERLRDFLEGGRFLNPWDECFRDAGGDEDRAVELLERKQGPEWYGRRALFEGSFAEGRRFRYGALYTGGRALVDSKFGLFCAVFRMDAATAWKLVAWLPANSLERYVPDEKTFDVERMRGEVGAHRSRHHVAAIKHENDVAACPPADWSTLLCEGDRFVEGIVADDLVPPAVERLLVDSAGWKTLEDAVDALLDGDVVEPQTHADADRFHELRAVLKKWDLHEEKV